MTPEITIKGPFIGTLVEVEITFNTSNGYQVQGCLVSRAILRDFVYSFKPVAIWCEGERVEFCFNSECLDLIPADDPAGLCEFCLEAENYCNCVLPWQSCPACIDAARDLYETETLDQQRARADVAYDDELPNGDEAAAVAYAAAMGVVL